MDLRTARAALFAVFFATGAVFAAWAARVPAIQERLDLSTGDLALVVLALEGGAVVGLPAGGALVARLGSRPGVRLGFALYPSMLAGAAVAPGLGALAAALAAMAAANSVVDVAMNAEGVEHERRLGRPVLARMHAGHSIGVLAGGLAGTAAAAAGVGVVPHFAAVAVLGLGVGFGAGRALVGDASPAPEAAPPGAADERPPAPHAARVHERRPPAAAHDHAPAPCAARAHDPRSPAAHDALARPRRRLFLRPPRALLGLGAIAFFAFLVDGTANAWSAVHLRTELGASPALAAAAFTAFAGAMAVVRLFADALVRRAGRPRVVVASGLVAAAGAALAVLAPAPGVALAGWGVLGAGIAAVAPAVLGAAPGAAAVRGPTAIAAVTTLGYLGSFTGPPLIGALAAATDLSLALWATVVAGGLVAALAPAALRPAAGARAARRR